jgi:sulfotransferase family protein
MNKADKKVKVFGIGMNKTGTKTLGLCLKWLGYTNTSYDLDLLKDAVKGDYDGIDKVVEEFDCFEDWPWPIIFRVLDERYPDSKFILTIRKNSETWFRSLEKQSVLTGPTEYRKIVYGYEMPQENKEAHVEIYEKHNEEVIEYFKDKPGKMLVICWETGSEWNDLCSFLNLPVPDIPFPHANKSSRRLKSVNSEKNELNDKQKICKKKTSGNKGLIKIKGLMARIFK